MKKDKVIIAPDSFKESLAAWDVARVIEDTISEYFPGVQVVSLPLSDGGEGMTHILARALSARIFSKKVTGPLGNPVSALYAVSEELSLGIMDVASVIGLHLIPKEMRNPLYTNTFGVGELIGYLCGMRLKKIIIGLGGSSTVDGGTGMAQALGFRFWSNNTVIERLCGGTLGQIQNIDNSVVDSKLFTINIQAACDVDNVLLGQEGAAYVFAPQKGATSEQVEMLEYGLIHLSQCLERDLNVEVADVKGAGAAGGLGAGLLGFLKAELCVGTDLIMNVIGFKKLIQDAGLIITGEGKYDRQSFYGKVVGSVVGIAEQYNIPVGIIAGIAEESLLQKQSHSVFAVETLISRAHSLEDSMANATTYIREAVRNIMQGYFSKYC